MCGICGIAFRDGGRLPDSTLLRRMADLMVHRGPDAEGYHIGPGGGLAVRRLSIIDVEGGAQPLYGEDGRVALVCNGEIYNYVELRRELVGRGHRFRTGGDAEVVVHLYEESGPECVHRLRGMFAFAIWDERRGRLVLARDRLGIKPLYYSTDGEGLAFASEMKPILAAGWGRREADVRAIDDLFRFGFVTASRTPFRGIRPLPPGHFLVWENGRSLLRRYWHPSFPDRDSYAATSADGWAEALRAKLEETVRLHLRSDVPIGAWLSAGLDSSTVAALASRESPAPLPAFSVSCGRPGFDEVERRGTLACRAGYRIAGETVVCPESGLEGLPALLWRCEHLSVSGIEVLQSALARASARHTKVVLTGEGADEVLGGYRWYRWERCLSALGFWPLALRRAALLGPLLPRVMPGFSRALLAPAAMGMERYRTLIGYGLPGRPEGLYSPLLRERLAAAGPDDEEAPRPDGFDRWHRFCQLQYYDMTVRLPGFVLHQLDRTSMAHSVEARVPFLDHEFVEFCAGIPPEVKMRGLREKDVLRRAMRDLLPRAVLRRRKLGLRAPHGSWLRGRLPDFAEQMLSEDALKRKGYFDAAVVRGLLSRHRERRGRHANVLMGVLAVQLWDELFLSGPHLHTGRGGVPH